MIRKAIYLGLVLASGWKFLQAIQRYRATTDRKLQHKEALQVWEGEGGNPAGRKRLSA